MIVPQLFATRGGREILVAAHREWTESYWLADLDSCLQPTGFSLRRCDLGADTVERVAGGGVAGAVVITEHRWADTLSMLRVIRSINLELPCWLIADEPTGPVLQTALALRVNGVMCPPVTPVSLSLTLTRVLVGQVGTG
ncbi:MAG: hypothetical protein AABZ47_14160 [Planctomycetota bacterium]